MTFADDLAAVDEVAARYFDTARFTAVPMAKPGLSVNAADVPDTTRTAFDFLGTLDIAPEFSAFATTNRPGASDRSVRQISRLCLTALSTGWPWVPRQGDRIRGVDALYAVAASPDRDGSARLVIWLNRISV